MKYCFRDKYSFAKISRLDIRIKEVAMSFRVTSIGKKKDMRESGFKAALPKLSVPQG